LIVAEKPRDAIQNAQRYGQTDRQTDDSSQ